MKSGDKVGQTCPLPRHKTIPVWISTGGSAFPRFPIRIRENCLPNVTSFLGNFLRKAVDTDEGAVFAIGREFEISSTDSLFVPRHKPLLERGRTVSPPGYMNAKDSAFRVIETLNRFFDTVEITGKQFVCKREKRKQFLMDVFLVAPFFEFLSSLDSLAGEKKKAIRPVVREISMIGTFDGWYIVVVKKCIFEKQFRLRG